MQRSLDEEPEEYAVSDEQYRYRSSRRSHAATSYGQPTRRSSMHSSRPLAQHTCHNQKWISGDTVMFMSAMLSVVLIVMFSCMWSYLQSHNGQGATGNLQADSVAHDDRLVQSVPTPVLEHHGNSPDCPEMDCMALLVNGDLLFHPALWIHFAGADTSATDGSAYDFTRLFELMGQYIRQSDIAVCEFETPVAPRGGPYTGYPIFAIPPEVAEAAKNIGYHACTHASNHSFDQGTAGIATLWDTLEANGLQQTGSYKDEASSMEPMVITSPTEGGKLAVVAGTVSINGMVADADWQIDRLREWNDPHHQSDIQRAVAKANKAREQGADVVAMSMHSLQEYLDYADSWQVSAAHELADTGAFDLIYGAGCHCVQPIEHYNNTWIIYGTGNAITVSAPPERIVNNQGITVRIQFAGKRGVAGSWYVNRIDWVPHANEQLGEFRWCPIASDKPNGTCWSEATDAAVRQRIWDVIYSMGADPAVVREWNITSELS